MKILKLSHNLSHELPPDEATSAIRPEQSTVSSATGEQSTELSSTDEQSHSLSSDLLPAEMTSEELLYQATESIVPMLIPDAEASQAVVMFSVDGNVDISQLFVISDGTGPTSNCQLGDVILVTDASIDVDGEEHVPTDTASNNPPLVRMSSLVTDSFTENADRPMLSAACEQQTGDTQEERRGRKRNRDEALWKRNILKRKRNTGNQYVNSRGHVVKAKSVQPYDCGGCRYKCKEKVSETDREKIFHSYWQLGRKDLQNDFITTHVDAHKKASGMPRSRKQCSRAYHFTLNGRRVRVCKEFFLKTLNVSNKLIHYNVSKMRTSFGTTRADGRGCSVSGNKISEAKREEVRKHIASFPAMESHYCRSGTTKKYLEANLSVKEMYRLYCEGVNGATRVKEAFYRQIFNTEFNLSFHRPKKDYCQLCTKYHNATASEKMAIQEEYDSHLKRKEKVRALKNDIKKRLSEDNSCAAVTFDLQQVLMAPKLNVSSVYYKRKLSTYNLTIYNLKDGSANCYMWHEGTAGRGSNEIASCVCKWLKTLPPETKHVYLFSDTCGGQNRNIQMAMALTQACVKSEHLQTVEQLMMESGHSQMECDSVHSTIERACKHIPLYTPMDYYATVRVARREAPYTVIAMQTNDFLDYKSLVTRFVRNRNRCDNKEHANWMKMKVLKYNKNSPGTVEFAYDYDGPFHKLIVNSGMRGRRPTVLPTEVPELYSGPVPISKAKYDDLQSLCTSLAIPHDYHHFYQSLTWSSSVKRERLPEPDVEENSDTDEGSFHRD